MLVKSEDEVSKRLSRGAVRDDEAFEAPPKEGSSVSNLPPNQVSIKSISVEVNCRSLLRQLVIT